MTLLQRHHLPGNSAGQLEHIPLGEHIEAHLTVRGHQIHAHHRLVAWSQAVRNKGRAGIKRICPERGLVVLGRLNVDHALAHRMEPVHALVVRIMLAGAVQELVQFLYLGLYALPPGHIVHRLREEVTVLERHKLLGVVLLHDIQDVLPNLLASVQDRLNASAIPVQEVLLEHILHMVDEGRVEFFNDILRCDVIETRIYVQPPKQVIPDNSRSGYHIVVQVHASIKNPAYRYI